MNTNKKLEDLHHHSFKNAGDLEGPPAKCRCFFCGASFLTTDVQEKDLLNEANGGTTICCPACNVDAVLVERNGIQLDDQIIKKMNQHYFHELVSLQKFRSGKPTP